MKRNPIIRGRLRRPVTPKDAMSIGRRIGESRKWTRDPERFEEFRMGLSEELEHRDVTRGRALSTGRIARAHLNKDDPRYYSKLKDMMARANPKRWKREFESLMGVPPPRDQERLFGTKTMMVSYMPKYDPAGRKPWDRPESERGLLTMDHSASSHGLPVLLNAKTREVVDPSDVEEITTSIWSYGTRENLHPLIAAAERAGYRVHHHDPLVRHFLPGTPPAGAQANPISGLTTGDKVWIHGEHVINPYKVVEDRGDRVVIRGFVSGFNAPDTYTINKGDIFRISRANPRPQDRVGFIGYYNELGYRICKMVDGRVVAEVYSAGNSPADSQQTVPARHGVGLKKIKEWAEQTGREIADEAESAFFGIEHEED
jgi:hypothetical protein